MNRKARFIRARLIERGVFQKTIAEKCKVSKALVSLNIAGLRRTPCVRQAISEAIGIPISDLWPDDRVHNED